MPLLLNPLFYRPIWVSHWLIPLVGLGVLYYLYRRMLSAMEARLIAAEKSHKKDLFPILPNYTGIFLRVGMSFGLVSTLPLAAIAVSVFHGSLPKRMGKLTAEMERMSTQSPSTAPAVDAENVELEADFSSRSWVWAVAGLRSFRVQGASAKLELVVPNSWDEDTTLAEMSQNAWFTERPGSTTFFAQAIIRHFQTFFIESPIDLTLSIASVLFMLAFGYTCLILYALAMACAAIGYWAEARSLRFYLSTLDGKTKAKAEPVRVVRPVAGWLFWLRGKKVRHWYFVLENAKGKKRYAILPLECLSISASGVLLNAWPMGKFLVYGSLVFFFVLPQFFCYVCVGLSIFYFGSLLYLPVVREAATTKRTKASL